MWNVRSSVKEKIINQFFCAGVVGVGVVLLKKTNGEKKVWSRLITSHHRVSEKGVFKGVRGLLSFDKGH